MDYNKSMSETMGAIRTKIILVNSVDEALSAMGQLAPEKVRRMEVDALVDTGAVSSVLPIQVVEQLGLTLRGHRLAQYADGRTEVISVTGPVTFQVLGRETIEQAMVLGDQVLIGQTVLEKTDLLADCQHQRLVPNPAHPDQPVLHV
jgi:clan AA aspartic protease